MLVLEQAQLLMLSQLRCKMVAVSTIVDPIKWAKIPSAQICVEEFFLTHQIHQLYRMEDVQAGNGQSKRRDRRLLQQVKTALQERVNSMWCKA